MSDKRPEQILEGCTHLTIQSMTGVPIVITGTPMCRTCALAAIEAARVEERALCAEIAERERRANNYDPDPFDDQNTLVDEFRSGAESVAEIIRDAIRARGGK